MNMSKVGNKDHHETTRLCEFHVFPHNEIVIGEVFYKAIGEHKILQFRGRERK
jgi:hypothetical protein